MTEANRLSAADGVPSQQLTSTVSQETLHLFKTEGWFTYRLTH